MRATKSLDIAIFLFSGVLYCHLYISDIDLREMASARRSSNELVQQFRKRFRLSQSFAAEMLGVRHALTISHWETGIRKPSGTVELLLLVLLNMGESEAEDLLAHLQRLARWRRNHEMLSKQKRMRHEP